MYPNFPYPPYLPTKPKSPIILSTIAAFVTAFNIFIILFAFLIPIMSDLDFYDNFIDWAVYLLWFFYLIMFPLSLTLSIIALVFATRFSKFGYQYTGTIAANIIMIIVNVIAYIFPIFYAIYWFVFILYKISQWGS